MPESSSSEAIASTPASAASPPFATERAFTLIELITVIAIIGIIAAVLIGGGRRAVETGRVATAKAELAALSAALESYQRRHGDYPRTNEAPVLLQSLLGLRGPTGNIAADAPMIELARFRTRGDRDAAIFTDVVLIDPWDRPYVYLYKSGAANSWRGTGPVLYSRGPDGADLRPDATTGAFDASVLENADNIYAAP